MTRLLFTTQFFLFSTFLSCFALCRGAAKSTGAMLLLPTFGCKLQGTKIATKSLAGQVAAGATGLLLRSWSGHLPETQPCTERAAKRLNNLWPQWAKSECQRPGIGQEFQLRQWAPMPTHLKASESVEKSQPIPNLLKFHFVLRTAKCYGSTGKLILIFKFVAPAQIQSARVNQFSR